MVVPRFTTRGIGPDKMLSSETVNLNEMHAVTGIFLPFLTWGLGPMNLGKLTFKSVKLGKIKI